MSEALKPCPFCGGPSEMWNAQDHRPAWISCMGKCAVLISKEHGTDAEAIAAWNARVDASERHADGEYIGHLQQRVEELEAALPQWRDMGETPDAPMPVLLFFGEREWRDLDGNTVFLDCPHGHAARMEVAFWDGEAWCEQNTGHDVFEPWNEHPTAWQPLTPPEQQ